MRKNIPLNNSNLYLYGFGKDINGNTIVKIGFPNQNAFSIQTNGNLPLTHEKRYLTLPSMNKADLDEIESEAIGYIKEYGSDNQKKSLKVYGSSDTYKSGGEIKSNMNNSEEIKKLEAALKSPATPEAYKAKLQAKLDALKGSAPKAEPKKRDKAEPKPKKQRPVSHHKGKKNPTIQHALKTRKPGEKWKDAVTRSAKELKGGTKKVAKKIKGVKPKVAKAPYKKKAVRKTAKPKATYKKKAVRQLVGSSFKAQDKMIKAKKPGKRISASGKTYYESRRNRADLNRRTRL